MKVCKFEIEKNRAGQRILIVGDNFRFEKYERVEYDEFDAVLYTSLYAPFVESQIMWLNPILSPEFAYKPLFIHPDITRKVLVNLSDGQYYSINDEGLIDEVTRIKQRMLMLGFETKLPSNILKSPEKMILSELRFYLTRGETMPVPMPKNGSSFGYVFAFRELLMKHGLVDEKTLYQMTMRFRTQNFYEEIELINIVHLCPECYHSHLIFTETCPSCKSRDVIQESMIHHFRCANISPEGTYLHGEKLICPKCTRELRHIGVDYDRPMGIYYCRSCSRTFSQPNMSAVCTSCGRESMLDQLQPFRTCKFKFTQKGMFALSKLSVYDNEDEKIKYEHLLSFKVFSEYLKSRISISNLLKNAPVQVIRISGEMTEEVKAILVDQINQYQLNLVSSYRHNAFYVILQTSDSHKLKELMDSLGHLLQANGAEDVKVIYFEYDSSMDPDDFIRQL